MSSEYAISDTQNAALAKTVIGAKGSATVTPGVFYASLENIDAPADSTIRFGINHVTSAGISTAITPNPLDANDRVAVTTAGGNYSSEPVSSGLPLIEGGMNQRSIWQFFAREGSEFKCLKAANAGITLEIIAVTSGTAEYAGTMHFRE